MTGIHPIYLDHNATAPIHPEVLEAMNRCAQANFANPASQHASGRRARQILEDARERIAELLGARIGGARSDHLIFTSGGTEANNLALFGLAQGEPKLAVISAIEHPSVAAAAGQLRDAGWQIEWLPASPDGTVDLSPLSFALESGARVASLMLANNETGVLQPVSEAARQCNAHGVALHTDAVQAVGKMPLNFRGLGAATLSFSAHKFQGPCGIGGLLARHDVALHPRAFGGHQQGALRPGTEPLCLVVGMCRALEICCRDCESRMRQMAALRDRFERRLAAGWPALVIHGRTALRLVNTTNIAFVGLDRQALMMAFDLAGVECSTGSACASGASDPSPTLIAMHVSAELLNSSLRFSLGPQTTAADVDEAADRMLNVIRKMADSTGVQKNGGDPRQWEGRFL
jgi:cysteine desulfurase